MRIVALILVCGCALLAQDARERALGDRLAADLRREMPALQHATLDEYVQAVVQRLGVAAYSYEVLDSSRKPDVTEPMPLPGGRILIPSAAFLAATDEAEFAALLAHAAGHLANGYATRAIRNPGNPEVIPLLYPGSVHQDSRGQAVVMLPNFVRLTQDEREREADGRAVETLTRAGYDASALHAYLARTAAPVTRLAQLPTHAADTATVTTSAFTRAQEAVRALLPPSPAQARRTPPTLRR